MWLTGNKAKLLLLLVIYWLGLNVLVIHVDFQFFPRPEVDPIQSVDYVASPVTSPDELDKHGWKKQILPDDWIFNHNAIRQIWYRAEIPLTPDLDQPWAIYLPSVIHNAAVYINGTWVGQGGRFSEPVSRHHNDPLLFSFTPELLRQGINRVDIRVKTSSYQQGFLGQFYLAPEALLLDAYRFKKIIRVNLVEWITAAMYAIGLVILAFWLARPKDSIYGLFALELFIWATHNLNLLITDIPVSTRLWEALTISTLGWTIITMLFFNFRYLNTSNPPVEKFLRIFALLGVGLFFLPDVDSVLSIGYHVWDVFLLIFGCYTMYFLIKKYWQTGEKDTYLMLVVGVPILVFGFHDILMLHQFLDKEEGLIMQFSVVPAVLLFSWFLVRRFVQSINKAENLAANLEQRVEQKTREIHSQYETLKSMQKQQVLAEERERIMRDMHDGIGGQLLSVVSLLHDHPGQVFSNVREKVQHCLTDLRFVIDSLDPLHNEIPVLLGMMRMRLQDQLEAAKVELEWAVTDLPEFPDMTPSRSLHIMRIVQEAITNGIKHADSRKMSLATGVLGEKQDQVYIDVIDYGKGIEPQTEHKPGRGRGIDNMLNRASQIGARLDITSTSEGTCVRLLLPLSA
jgi:signal transduction histidine kinase